MRPAHSFSLALLLAPLFAVGACSHAGQEVRSPNGEVAYSIECRHTRGCLEQAQTACPGGYEMVTIASDGSFAPSTETSHSLKEMIVRCRGAVAEACKTDPLMMSNQDHARWMLDPNYCPR